MLTKADAVGFGFSDVHMAAGAEAVLWYKHHWEANHVLTTQGWPPSSSSTSCRSERTDATLAGHRRG
jgi:hypothetical protein